MILNFLIGSTYDTRLYVQLYLYTPRAKSSYMPSSCHQLSISCFLQAIASYQTIMVYWSLVL
jgi:hypothetical protein